MFLYLPLKIVRPKQIINFMLKRVKASLAFRLPPFYKYLLKYRKLKAIKKPPVNLQVLMMTGRHHLPMLRFSVYAIAKNWASLPKLTIINDGSVDDHKIQAALNFWQGDLEILNWSVNANYHKQKGRTQLANYAAAHPFGKKMAAILQYAEDSPTLWVDSDILFFKDPIAYLPAVETGLICGATEDWFRAYDENVLSLLPPNNLHILSGMNAGMLFVYGEGIYEKFDIENMLLQIHPDYAFFTEQTIFAYIASTSLAILWDNNTVKNTQEDNQELRVVVPEQLIARHYTSIMRQLFWRDVMFNL